ncbi:MULTISPECIES: HU family DNA-binding protein [Succinivibrio]|uniref:HU family DNA-binding protein n=1 Tax=Succinivibrio TaxID=83770 RepID=UPI00345C6B05
MSNRLNLPSATAYDCTKCIFSIISECLRENKVVTINNFGSFQVKKTKERRIYVPSERAYRIKNSFNKVNFKSRINF